MLPEKDWLIKNDLVFLSDFETSVKGVAQKAIVEV